MEYGFTYFDNIHGYECSENAYPAAWASFWDAERTGEITILEVVGTTNGWETIFEVYRSNG